MKKFFILSIIMSIAFSTLIAHDELFNEDSDANSVWVVSHRNGIVTVHVDFGEYVKKGQLLFEQAVGFQEIDLEVWKKKEVFSKFVYNRVEKNREFLVAKKIYLLIICDLKVANAMLQKVKAEIENSKYYAPFDGTVTKINCYDGSGLGNDDPEIEVTKGHVKVNLSDKKALVCNREAGIIELVVKLGQNVKKGQFLFKTKTNELEAQLKADLAESEYKTKLFEKNKKLNRKSVALFDFLRSGIDAIEGIGAVKKDEMLIEVSSQYAPFDGIITHIYKYSGSGTGHDKPIMQIKATVP